MRPNHSVDPGTGPGAYPAGGASGEPAHDFAGRLERQAPHVETGERPAQGFALQEQVLLAPYTTFGIGGPARWFATVTTEAELVAACTWAAAQGLPLFVLGGGSNLLVSDSGYAGLVIHMAIRGIRQQPAGPKRLFLVGAGEDWEALITHTVEAGCAGMECLAGIPGSVGATPVQNVGAYGQEVAQTIHSVRCYDRLEKNFVCFDAGACGFAYRTSRFNTAPDRGRFIVTEVAFALRPGGAAALQYADLQRHFAGHAAPPTLAEVAEAVRSIRRGKGMVVPAGPLAARDPDTRSAGSFFKNPVISAARFHAIAADYAHTAARPGGSPDAPAVPSYPAPPAADGTPQRKLPAAWLLEQAGFRKGFALGGAAVSSRHTLALSNHSGNASAAEILALRDTLAAGVYQRFGIVLEPEPIFLG